MPSLKTHTAAQKRAFLNQLKSFLDLYGYEWRETSVLEPSDLFLTRAGDQIIDRLLTFEHMGQDLALRPEFTATATHDYIALPQTNSIIRWQFSGPIFEYDTTLLSIQQQESVGAELFGMSSIAADAEMIAVGVQAIHQLGIQNWTLTLGNIALLRVALKQFDLDPRTERYLLNHIHELRNPARGADYVIQQLDRLLGSASLPAEPADMAFSDLLNTENEESHTRQLLDVLLDATQRGVTMGGRTRHDIARRLLEKRQRAAQRPQILQAIQWLTDWCGIYDTPETAFEQMQSQLQNADHAQWQPILDVWKTLTHLLVAYGILEEKIMLQPARDRNWDYYTGIVFDIQANDQLLAGGGRYDGLTQLLGGNESIPAVGIAFYLDAIMNVASAGMETSPILTLVFTQANLIHAIQWGEHLRKHGLRVELVDSADSSSQLTAIVTDDGLLEFRETQYAIEDTSNLIGLILGA